MVMIKVMMMMMMIMMMMMMMMTMMMMMVMMMEMMMPSLRWIDLSLVCIFLVSHLNISSEDLVPRNVSEQKIQHPILSSFCTSMNEAPAVCSSLLSSIQYRLHPIWATSNICYSTSLVLSVVEPTSCYMYRIRGNIELLRHL